MPAATRCLPYGSFYGNSDLCREIPGFSLALVTPVLRAEDVPLHTHPEGTFVLVLAGSYLSSAAHLGAECGPGTLIYNPPRTTHRDRFKTHAGRFLLVSVSRESFRSAADSLALPDAAEGGHGPEAVQIARRLARECARWQPCSPLLAEGLCFELLGAIAGEPAPLAGPRPSWLRNAKELLRECCGDALRIADASRTIGVHPVHFARSFRRYLRCTPGEYLVRCRLEKAVSLLRQTDSRLAQIALETGFFDQSHLSRLFRRHFGVSPLQFRRSARRSSHASAARG